MGTCDWSQIGSNVQGDPNKGYIDQVDVGFSDDGTILAFGERGYDRERGRVRVFAYDGTTWEPVGDPMVGESIGEGFYRCKLSGDGRTVVIGSTCSTWTPRRDRDRKVTVHRFKDWHWIKLGGDLIGEEVAAITYDGSRVVVSSYGSGQVKVFDYDGTTWEQVGSTVEANGPSDGFGWEVDISADGLRFVAATMKGNNGRGYMGVFGWSGSDWISVVGKAGSDMNDECGGRVAISSDGSRYAYSCIGIEKVFVWDIESDRQVGSAITNDFDGDGTGQGIDLSSDGSTLVIASPLWDEGRGFVRVFNYSPVTSNWERVAPLRIQGEASGDMEGISVRISGDGSKVATNSVFHDSKNGGVRVFALNNTLGSDL